MERRMPKLMEKKPQTNQRKWRRSRKKNAAAPSEMVTNKNYGKRSKKR